MRERSECSNTCVGEHSKHGSPILVLEAPAEVFSALGGQIQKTATCNFVLLEVNYPSLRYLR